MFPDPSANSLQEQTALEERVLRLYRQLEQSSLDEFTERLRLRRDAHAAYAASGLSKLPGGYISLDASRPWLVFWIVHSLSLLEVPLPPEVPPSAIVAFLARCQHASGGFGGGPGQLPHLAPTYAAVATLVTLGGAEALEAIHRHKLWSFLCRMCVPPHEGGGFHMCEGGEVDVRGCYTAMAVAHMVNLDAAALAFKAHMTRFIRACQTYEGGIGGEPGNEAHGGYAFCGLAAAMIAGDSSCLNPDALAEWATSCQGAVEGGFMGRTNKLVDGCYSYWVGALFPLLARLQQQQVLKEQPQREQPAEPSDVADSHVHAPDHDQQQQQRQQQQEGKGKEQQQGGVAADDSLSSPANAKGAAALVQQWGLHTPATSAAMPAGSHTATVAASVGDDTSSSEGSATAGDKILSGEGFLMSTRFRAVTWEVMYDAQALQLWLLHCCQGPKGGLRDKPGKPVDFYHTCYCLSGLASAQHYSGIIVGPHGNRLPETDLLCNVVKPRVEEARQYFAAQLDP